jgi:hypothetical protein
MSDEVIPDDKNWTWVLERRCDDCGFDAANFVASNAGRAIRDQAVRWTAVLGRDGVEVRPGPGVWSPLEYGCHVRDVFRKFDGRLAMMLDHNDPHFENWDQDATAIVDRYDTQDPRTVAAELGAAAEALAARFDSVAGDQWLRRGYRSDGAAFTVETLAKYLMHDPVHHLWDVGAETPAY